MSLRENWREWMEDPDTPEWEKFLARFCLSWTLTSMVCFAFLYVVAWRGGLS